MFRPSLTEKMKLEIARLYNTTDMPVEAIATQLKVSARSVHRFKNYRFSIESNSQNQPPETYPENIQDHGKPQRRCKRCGYTTDKIIKGACPRCGSGPFASISVEIGSPGYEHFVEENKKKQQEEETIHWDRDYYFCQDCDYCSNTEFKICPDCHSRAVEFAPKGQEPRDQSKYKDPEPQDNEDSDPLDHEESGDDNETDIISEEEKAPEYEYECARCHYQFNEVLENCPQCGMLLPETWQCSKCGHRWYAPPDNHCPKCNYKPSFY